MIRRILFQLNSKTYTFFLSGNSINQNWFSIKIGNGQNGTKSEAINYA